MAYYPTVALDIETACAVEGCTKAACKHPLYPHTARITCVGIYIGGEDRGFVFRNLNDLRTHLHRNKHYRFVGHNFKFDLLHLKHNGINIPLEQWRDDTRLMASVCIQKVDPSFLAWYEETRKIHNKKLPRGYSHRPARQHSLKTLAPYFLNVDPFWENPVEHDNDEYVLKDCKYTYKLCLFLAEQLILEGSLDFYRQKLLPWTKVLLDAEATGITVDLDKLKVLKEQAETEMMRLRAVLDDKWAAAYASYLDVQLQIVANKYNKMTEVAIDKLKNSTKEKKLIVEGRYAELCHKAAAKLPHKMNIDSPAQIAWILNNYYKVEVQSTEKAVLQKLAEVDVPDLKLYLEYRHWMKLATAFYPSYERLNRNGIMHCSFNPCGTRTGRLSSSGPNLQQVPAEVHPIFVARPGMVLGTFDMKAIETVLIAYYTEDPALLDIIFSGDDFHGTNAKLYFPHIKCSANEIKKQHPEERSFAKRLGYALFYGAGINRIQKASRECGYNWDLARCREAHVNFKTKYKKVFEYKEWLDSQAIGNPVKNMFGRKHAFDDATDIYMKNFNTLIQGSASDLVLEAARRISEVEGIKVLLLVHDELVCEFEEDSVSIFVEWVENCMTQYHLKTPRGYIKLEVEHNVSKIWSK